MSTIHYDTLSIWVIFLSDDSISHNTAAGNTKTKVLSFNIHLNAVLPALEVNIPRIQWNMSYKDMGKSGPYIEAHFSKSLVDKNI